MMPRSAQYLPDTEGLAHDKGIVLELSQCSRCGLIQLACEPVPYYREVIRATSLSDEMRLFRVRQFESFLQKYGLTDKKVIEIGCGRGENLSILNRLNVRAFGLEYAEAAVEQCVRAGLAVERGFLESDSASIAGAPYDAFIVLNYLEHLPNINGFLQGIHNNLRDGAIGLVEVPNFDMMLKNSMFSEITSDHLFYFTKESLTTLLSMNGFEVLECRELWREYLLSCVVRKRGITDVSSFIRQHAHVRRQLHDFIDRFPRGTVAVWGAGHQAMAVMAMTDIAARISYVVDSAVFKQGRYTSATHLPIVPPERLVSEPMEAILVMAAAYSDEIVNTIRNILNVRIQTAVLRPHGLEELPE